MQTLAHEVGPQGVRVACQYRIATNVCLNALRRRSRRPATVSSFGEVPWLQPYPDLLLDELPSEEDEPDAARC